jgi:hypothetical protein
VASTIAAARPRLTPSLIAAIVALGQGSAANSSSPGQAEPGSGTFGKATVPAAMARSCNATPA